MLQNKPCEATKRRKKRSCSGRVASNPSGDTRSHTLDRHERARSHAYTPQRDINFRRQKTLIHIHVMAINDPPPQPGYRLALPCVRVCDGATAAASCCWGTRQLYLAIWITNAGKIPKICILLIKGFIDGEKWVKSSVYGASYRPETNETERERNREFWWFWSVLVGGGFGCMHSHASIGKISIKAAQAKMYIPLHCYALESSFVCRCHALKTHHSRTHRN